MKNKYLTLLLLLVSALYAHGQCSITCPENVVATCSYDVPFISPAAYTDCGTVVLQTWKLTGATTGSSPNTGINDASLEIFQSGVTTVTYYVEDDNGYSATCSFTVTITDVDPPLLICPNDILVANDPGKCSAKINDFGFMSAFDNCSGIILEQIYGLPRKSDFPVGTTTNTFKFTDAAGNSSTCSFNITVTDEEDPTITCPGNVIVNNTPGLCSANVTVPLPIASDNCGIDFITNDYNDGGADASDIYPIGTTTVTYTVTDHVGRTATCSTNVTVVNVQTPIVTLNGPSQQIIDVCDTYDELGATAEDTCLGDISESIIIDNSSLDTHTAGSYTVTYMVSGFPESQVARTVTVTDKLPPTLSLIGPNPLTIGDCSTYTELGAKAIDCTGDLSDDVVITGAVDSNTLGTYYVTYSATDASGNTASKQRTVNVIDVNIPQLTLNGPNPQIIDACTPYVELGAIAIDPCSNNDISANLVIDASAVNTSIPGTYNVTYNVTDSNDNSADELVRIIEVVDTSVLADAGANITNTSCTDTSVTLSGNTITTDGITGQWTVTSGQTGGFAFSDPTSPISTFQGDVGETYELTWSIDNPCGISSDTMTVTFIGCDKLDFDGVDDNITFRNNYNFTDDFSIEVWIKSHINTASVQTIISKRDSNNLTDGYDLRLVNNTVSFHWNDGNALNSPYPIAANIWHHIAITYGNQIYTLYIDGIMVNSSNGDVPISNSYDCLVGAMDQTVNMPFKPINYFNGDMDELRIWNMALTANQIHKMMNQEIQDDTDNVKGSVVPLQIQGLSWSNLLGYYQMNQSSDILNGKLISKSQMAIKGTLRYMTSMQDETAPLPYISNTDGLWTNSSTWLYGLWQTIPNGMGIDGSTPIDWNIVKTSHNISSGNNNITLLALEVKSNTLSVENTNPLDGQYLRITDYLKIDGTLDLVGESQLLQDTGSAVDYTSSGTLQKDQQRTSNLYNYNYWGSPVSLNGSNYTINSVLRDGTNPDNPKTIQWTTSYDANGSTDPITLSNRWLYSFENYPLNSYASWRYLGAYNSLNVGLGFTMKGSGALSTEQNYVFVGLPNNGTINIPISAGNQALVGNPYPSTIDANKFIIDNSSSTKGSLYFWEHYPTNQTHILRDYQGGYAIYNLVGGNPAVSPPEISNNGTPTKTPERYIPVAQGFFVESNGTSGTVVFNNAQRAFVKKGATGELNNGSVFMKSNSSKNNQAIIPHNTEDVIKRIRLDFKSPEGAIRHLLLGFVSNGVATDGFDYGYDALKTDNFPSDLSWMIDHEQYVVQGVSEFNENKKYPLGMVLATAGNIEISLQKLENFDTEINVFIYDDLLGSYTKIDDFENYHISLDSGTYLNRFYLAFKQDNSSLSIDEQDLQHIVATYLNDSDEIYINIPLSIQLERVNLINVLGQTITSWNMTKTKSQNHEFKIPINHISEGAYVIKMITNFGTVNKKVLIRI